MEILMLVLLYYLSQNPDFAESVKPLMSKIKDSEHMLCFLNDLSKFTQTFSTFRTDAPPPKKDEAPEQKKERPQQEKKDDEKEKEQSPTEGIADEFIQSILDSYLKSR